MSLGAAMLAAPGVSAQSDELVSNIDQAETQPAVLIWETGRDLAQRFTTGSPTTPGHDEWVVDKVTIRIAGPEATPTYRVSIREASGDAPGAVLGHLDGPDGLDVNRNNVDFTAQGGGITLAANTDYFVVVDVIEVSETIAFMTHHPAHANSGLGIVTTFSTAEDDDASDGWSIGDVYSFEGRSYTSDSGLYWRAHWDRALKIAVHGESRARSDEGSSAGAGGGYTAGGEQWDAGGVPVNRAAACQARWRAAKAAFPGATVIVHCD
jgi:hypothetical protein